MMHSAAQHLLGEQISRVDACKNDLNNYQHSSQDIRVRRMVPLSAPSLKSLVMYSKTQFT